MRRLTTILFSLTFVAIAWGQGSNDNCSDAMMLSLEQVPPCREDGIFTLSISASNEGATPSLPFFQLNNFFGDGQALNGPVADVWFALQVQSNRLQIDLEGMLADPVLVLFQAAGGCAQKFPVAFSRGSGKLEAKTEPGLDYLLLVSGGELSDQGGFTLAVQSYNDCSVCAGRRGRLSAVPAPENGAYLPGQSVQFCYEITQWDPGQALEWLHGLQLAFGPAWDLSTLQTMPPVACSAPYGQWGWYDSWQSCMSGQSFGPGFAFDSQLGLLCAGGSPLDGDPGNNFGDGLCGNLIGPGPLPLEFCWTIQVKNDFSTGDPTNLNLQLSLLGDGYSSSWMPFHCGTQATTDFLATARPAIPLLPEVTLVQAPCINNCNGILSISGVYAGASWSYTLKNGSGNSVFSGSAINGSLSLGNICAGAYELELSNVSLGIQHFIPIEVPARSYPNATASFIPACSTGQLMQLSSNNSSLGQFVVHSWQGPGGFFSTQPSPVISSPGTYTLTLIVDGCAGQPIQVEAPATMPSVECMADSDNVLFTWAALPHDTAYQLNVLSGHSGSFVADTAFFVNGLAPGEAVSIELAALGTGPCPLVTVTAACTTPSCPPLTIAPDTVICPGGQAQLWLDAPTGSTIEWSPASSLSCTDCPAPLAQPTATTTYIATVNTPSGCIYTEQTRVHLNSLPDGILPSQALYYCPGEAFTVCLPPQNTYLWMSPFGFITTGNCLNFVNPTASLAGLYRIQVRLPGGCRFTETLRLQVHPDCGGLLPPWMLSQAPAETSGMAVFPNPASSFIMVELPQAGPAELVLFDLSGRLVLRWHTQEQLTRLPLNGLPNGAYLLQVTTPQGRESKRVMVAR